MEYIDIDIDMEYKLTGLPWIILILFLFCCSSSFCFAFFARDRGFCQLSPVCHTLALIPLSPCSYFFPKKTTLLKALAHTTYDTLSSRHRHFFFIIWLFETVKAYQ